MMTPQQLSMMMSSQTAYWGTLCPTILTFFFFFDMFRRYCPPHIYAYLQKFTNRFFKLFFDPYIHITIHDRIGTQLHSHKAYSLVESYLSANSSKDARRLKGEMPRKKLVLSLDERETTEDVFNGVKVWWYSGKKSPPSEQARSFSSDREKRYYELKFHKRDKAIVTGPYLDHVIRTGEEIEARNTRQKRLYTNGGSSFSVKKWSHIVFEHPASFETLAMKAEKKAEIIDDLLTFSRSKDFYKRIGKAWKRGYLLFGPPGTGKSTMIAAMANLLDYDIYDLELTSVKDNTELRRLLTETTGKSIIVIEDIDCSLELTGQREKKHKAKTTDDQDMNKKDKWNGDEYGSGSKVTLSGLLNFIDGIWSACAGERLVVFTTNYVDKLDPALTRRGRMDKHIELSYCGYEGFKVLVKNYLEIEDHPLFERVEELIEKVKITPADVAENLMPKSAKEGPGECIRNLIRALEEAERKQNIAKTADQESDSEESEESEESIADSTHSD